MKTNQKGFTLIETLLVVLILAVVGFGGYYVWRVNHKPTAPVTKAKAATKSITKAETLSKTYTNDQYGFSFRYPVSWQLKTDLADQGRGGPEGSIYVQSTSGIKVHFDPNFGGKGGECADSQANNQETARTCTTRDITSVDELPDSGTQTVWLEKGSDTPPTSEGGQTSYFIYLTTGMYNFDANSYTKPSTGSTVGAYLGAWDDVQLKKAALNVFIEGANATQNSSSAFFNIGDVNVGVQILNSFKIL